MIKQTKKSHRFGLKDLQLAIYTGARARLKGIVDPKIKILSLFNHPQVVPNQTCMSFILMLNTKYILKNVASQTLG